MLIIVQPIATYNVSIEWIISMYYISSCKSFSAVYLLSKNSNCVQRVIDVYSKMIECMDDFVSVQEYSVKQH